MGQALWSLQGEQGRRLCLRLQDAIRWWKVNWFRSDLRLARGSQEVRATLPTGPIRSRNQDWEGQQAAAQAAQESFEGAAGYCEGQGRKEEEGRLNDCMIHTSGAARLAKNEMDGCHVAYLHGSSLQMILHTGKAMALGFGLLFAW